MTEDEIFPNAPTDDLVRHVTFRAEPSNDGQTLEGYAAVFNEWTDIDSWEGTFRERIAPGAFKKTLSERMPVLQFDHGTHPLIGSLPLGVFTSLKEDEHGLRVRARLSDNWLVQPIRDAIRDGAITGMSFRFRAINDTWRKGSDKTPERTITEIALYEAGPVVFPAYEQTTVGVRSRELLTALADPQVRSELALLLTSGTELDVSAATEEHIDEPVRHHSTRTPHQRRALALLKL
jgi:HK97 family phage prohead protease